MAAAPIIPVVEAHVGNIDYNVTVKDVVEYFSSYGSVVQCKLLAGDRGRGRRHKGCGFVKFASVQDLEVVLSASHTFRGRKLKVSKSNHAGGLALKDESGIFLFHHGRLHVGVYMTERGQFLRKWEVPIDVLTVVNFQRRFVKFSFSYDEGFRKRKVHIKHNLDDIVEMIDTKCSDHSRFLERNAIIFRSQSAPRLNEEEIDSLSELLQDLVWESIPTDDESNTVKRVTDFTPDKSLSVCFDYMLVATDISRSISNFKSTAERYGHEVTPPATGRGTTPITNLAPQPKFPVASLLPYKVLFQIDVLVAEGILYQDLIPLAFYQLLKEIKKEKTAIRCLEMLLQSGMYPIEDPVSALRDTIQRVRVGGTDAGRVTIEKPNLDPSTAVPIHRVFVTPLRTICWGPETDTPNRVIRQFSQHLDRFLRVSFTDEDWNKLQVGKSEESVEEIYDRVRRTLRDGLVVGHRRFEFLATSSSQLREHACWFFASTGYLTADYIRSWMGDFSSIRNVAKYAARMGQCFSSTVTGQECAVKKDEFEYVRDIKTSDLKYTFTDGIGAISPEFARVVAKSVGRLKGRKPSAFQIRFAGSKGVVAVDERMRGGHVKLRLRPSMRKFESDHFYVEVCKTSSLMPCFLNRQIVTLLSTLDIRDEVFLKRQTAMVADLNQMLYNAKIAVNHLKQSCNPSPKSTLGRIIEMMESGFDMKEPFLQGVLKAYRLAQLQDLRNRARIYLKEGACLMGVIDETRTLKYGQVFVRVSNPANPGAGPTTIQKRVAIAKNPCFHPGDVRSVEAVDVPQLHHLVDCLVFPADGPRPLTDQCSGSDLDGDLYFVTWDRELIPFVQYEPMDYQGITPKPIEHPTSIKTSDLHDFFIKYIKNDQLGPIANAHLVWSDHSLQKALDQKCLKLAELHSVAVDYPKTGVPAVMTPDLRPQFYPNFMNKTDRVQYRSQSVVGKLFAEVDDDFEREKRTIDDDYNARTSFDHSLVMSGFHEYVDKAQHLRESYNHDLRGIMEKYDIKKESEAVTGNVLRVGRKLRRTKLADIRLQIRLEVNELIKSYRVPFDQEFQHDDGSTSRRLRVASAWYCVTYSPDLRPELVRSTAGRYKKPLLSFPWILTDCLCEIKQSRPASGRPARV
ncbi:uncharacterized protein LOC134180209 [Corticium candelabrum]|uniref:uncharacterized protein LOC134180209 n=1 Tax=Corticium candelabrum TaxID=121492 RepID=UPI002E263A26|nr:uncharacterized protein LOC134180209 [Corticium candelabrum]